MRIIKKCEMSYKKKKLKESRFGQLKYQLGKIGRALVSRVQVLLQRRSNVKVFRLGVTEKIMEKLREMNRWNVPNNKKIDQWVDEYVNERILNGRPVEILLQWCTGLGLVQRKEKQGGELVLLSGESDLIYSYINRVLTVFEEYGVRVNWTVTFNRSYINRRRLPDQVFFEYKDLIESAAKDVNYNVRRIKEDVLFLDWDDVAINGIKPNEELLNNFGGFVKGNALEYEVRAFIRLLKQYPDALISEDALAKEAQLRIAFEAEEAKFLVGPDSPFKDGKFILIPLERPERYNFFNLFVPEFSKRIASVVPLYPWRMRSEKD